MIDGEVTTSFGRRSSSVRWGSRAHAICGPNQINAIVPSTTYGQDFTTLGSNAQRCINGPTMLVRPTQPGVFSGAVNQDGSVNSAANPAGLGSVVTIWGTGAGVSSNPQYDGAIISRFGGSVPRKPGLCIFRGPILLRTLLRIHCQFWIRSRPVTLSLEVLFAGDAPNSVAGVTQVNFRLPSTLDGIAYTSGRSSLGSNSRLAMPPVGRSACMSSSKRQLRAVHPSVIFIVSLNQLGRRGPGSSN